MLTFLRNSGYFKKPDVKVIVISPFANVQMQARKCVADVLSKNQRSCVDAGTIHRFQGREADIVFLVLGSVPGTRGLRSRQWADNRPNMPNVAVSRAKKRLYVIGNYIDWYNIDNFCEMAGRFHQYNRISSVGFPGQTNGQLTFYSN